MAGVRLIEFSTSPPDEKRKFRKSEAIGNCRSASRRRARTMAGKL
jgi:hypothetical protein